MDEYLIDPGQVELGLKKRGSKKGIEVKGLVTQFAQPIQIGSLLGYCQIWTKWTAETLRLDGMTTAKTYKARWLRKYEIGEANIAEIRPDKLPNEGCNVELTTVSLAKSGPRWWTIGFEAFGSFQSVGRNLHLTLDHLRGTGIPQFTGGRDSGYPAWLDAQHQE